MKKQTRWLSVMGGIILGCFIINWQQRCIEQWKVQANKNRGMFMLMNQWVNVKQDGKSLKDYFLKNDYLKIAVYGMGDIGKRLAKELKNSDVEVVYGIDQNKDIRYSDIQIVSVSDHLANVDAVVVTVLDKFYEISDVLAKKIHCPVLAIEDILNEI